MHNNLLSRINRFLPFIIFGLMFAIFVPAVANLRLFIDDHVLIWPALTKSYVSDLFSYTYTFGLYRPFRLIFIYYPLYTIYLLWPWLPYILQFFLHLATGVLVYRVFKHYVESRLAMLLSLSYIVFPFFTEQYGWLATGVSLVNFIFFLQLYIALISKASVKWKLISMFILQLIAALTYDTLFFNFLFLGALMYKERHSWHLSVRKVIIFSLLFALPSIMYVVLRSFVWYPHDATTLRELKVSDIGRIIPIEWHNLMVFLKAQQFLFFGQGSWTSFWQENFRKGLDSLLYSPFELSVFNYLLIALAFYFIKKSSPHTNTFRMPVAILLFSGALSLAPAFLVTIPSFPFRVIAFSLWCTLAAFLLISARISRSLAYVLTSVVIFIGLIFSLQMLKDMRKVYDEDDKMTTQIVNVLDQHVVPGQKATVIINNMPYSTQTDYNYGEYLGSCVRIDWCVQMELARKTDKVEKVIINPSSPVITYDTVSFTYDEHLKSLLFND